MLPTPTLPSFRGGACADRSAAKDWSSQEIANPVYQRFLANTYCAHCPIAEMCLEQALKRGEVTGVWGGLIEVELVKARAKAKAQREAKRSAGVPADAEPTPVELGVAA